MVHSPSHWPGSSGWGRSGRTPDLRHFADTGTGLWPAGTRSPRAQYTGCVQYPGSYMCTLKGKKRLNKISFDFWSIANVQHRAFSVILTPAVSSGSIPEIAALADATVGTFSVVKAFVTLSGLTVTGVHVWHVYVVVTLARLAAPSWLRGVTVITRGTFLTSGT